MSFDMAPCRLTGRTWIDAFGDEDITDLLTQESFAFGGFEEPFAASGVRFKQVAFGVDEL